MQNLRLIIGNKNYSSWSLRPWLALKRAGAAFDEIYIPLYEGPYKEQIRQYSPSGKVPCLIDGSLTVWDSLAICEYVNEKFPAARLWPAEQDARAVARAVSAEMHSGFANVRTHMSMNLRRSIPGRGMYPAVHHEIERITEIWRNCRTRYGSQGEFLFGAFTIADAMFAPVVTRFQTYGVQVDPVSERYMKTVVALPAMQEWLADAKTEKHSIPAQELYL